MYVAPIADSDSDATAAAGDTGGIKKCLGPSDIKIKIQI